MNNFNGPPGWDFRPDRQGDGDGNKWNYALLVPVLSLAAFRWVWTKESQREIGEVKAVCDRDLKAVSSDLETKYQEALTESRITAARTELELEKERQRAQGYRQALLSQGQQLLEERKQLQEEREALEEQRRRAEERGLSTLLLDEALEREGERQAGAADLLSELESGLVERQSAFCSHFLPRKWRLEMERKLLARAAEEPLAAELDVESGLRDVFRNDRHCNTLSRGEGKNGSLMWLYLRYWRMQVTLQKHKRALEALRGVTPDQK